jgi:hypothetical protein
MTKLIDKTLKELKDDLIGLGFEESVVNSFNTKNQIVTVIEKLMKAREEVSEVKQANEEIKRVATLEDNDSPKEKKLLEQRYLTKAQIMRKKLMAQPKVRTILPLEPNEKPGKVEWRTDKNGQKYQKVVSGSFHTVTLNGFKWFIPKGTPTDVPEQVSHILDQAYLRTQAAGRAITLDRNDPRTNLPMSESL